MRPEERACWFIVRVKLQGIIQARPQGLCRAVRALLPVRQIRQDGCFSLAVGLALPPTGWLLRLLWLAQIVLITLCHLCITALDSGEAGCRCVSCCMLHAGCLCTSLEKAREKCC